MTISGALTREADNPLLAQGGGGAWDELKIGPLNIMKVAPGDYRMWYEGINAANTVTSMGYATSTDGRNWTKSGSNPIFVATEAWENSEVTPDTIIRVSASDWRMWYHGGYNIGPRQIGYATSADGIAWTRGAGSLPVLANGGGGAWDEVGIADACVIRMSATDYRMWYKGESAGAVEAVGYATSSDGITWAKSGSNPIFSDGAGGQWDDDFIHGLWVFQRGGDPRFHGWYSGGDVGVNDGGVGYAWSLDGIAWTRGASNPVLAGISTESISDPVFVYEDDGILRVIYFYEDVAESPVERTHGEARGSPAPDPLTICVTASGDDDNWSRSTGGYPPTGGGAGGPTEVEVSIRKISNPFDEIVVGFVRFDTSLIPDQATIISADLLLYIVNLADNDNRALVAEWRTFNPPAVDADWVENVGTTAIAGTDITSLTGNAINTFSLSNPTNVNKFGYTGFRLGISGPEPPIQDNLVTFASFDNVTNPEPCLIVTYTSLAALAWIRG